MDKLWCSWIVGTLILLLVGVITTQEIREIEDEEDLQYNAGITAIFLVSRRDSTMLKKIESTIEILNESDDLASGSGLSLGIADCDKAKLSFCKVQENINSIIALTQIAFYRVMGMDEVQEPLQLVSAILNSTVLEEVKEITTKQELEEQRKDHPNITDIVMIYLPELEIEEHMEAMVAIKRIPDNVTPFITHNSELLSLQTSLSVEKPLMQWLRCEQNATFESCSVTFSTSDLSGENLAMLMTKAVKMIILDKWRSSFKTTLREWTNLGVNSLILIAGHGKNEVAIELAREFKEIMEDSIQCVVVFGETVRSPAINYRVQDDKIFAAISQETNPDVVINMGYLDEETTDELTSIWQRVMSDDDLLTKSMDELVYDEEFPNPEEVEDDPVAHAVHSSSDIRKLYYYDYKTIPRLTDKTFTEVTKGDDYAVVLVTLEFNSRAIAALTMFIEIHLKYKENGGTSPLYRLECYNWPDVCQKIEVYTTPRMFFKPAKSQEMYEYKGMWDKTEMENHIERFKRPTVLVVNNKDELLEKQPIPGKIIMGLFKSSDGVAEFQEAAKELRSEIAFYEMHGTAGEAIASELVIPFEHRTILAIKDLVASENDIIFKTKDDIIKFAATAYEIRSTHELTVKSYPKLMASEKPLAIYFMSPTKSKLNKETMAVWDKLALSDEKIILTWMDTKNNSVSDFVLGKYNSKAKLEMPIISLLDKKGSVMLKSCASTDCSEKSLRSWLEDCLAGKITGSYTMSKEPWKPRLAGYDYLEIMKQENTYPVPKTPKKKFEGIAKKWENIEEVRVKPAQRGHKLHSVSKPTHTEL